jgi:hypothetical protein
MLVFAEILVDMVFIVALLAALGSLVYLVALTVRERHLGLELRAAQAASEPTPVSRAVARAHPRRAVLHRS